MFPAMGKRITSSSNPQNNSPHETLHASEGKGSYCLNLDHWAQSWAGFPKLDVPVGEKIVEEFKPFLQALGDAGYSKKTLKRYADFLWALGGEVIRHVNEEPADRKLPARELLLRHIDETGGPYWPHAYNARDRNAFNSVCRRLYRFMTTGVLSRPTTKREEP